MDGRDEFDVRRLGIDATGREPDDRTALVAAYREGLGLAAIVVICGPAGTRISANLSEGDEALGAAETVRARWWCRRATQAERIALAAAAQLRRRKSADTAPRAGQAAGHRRDDEDCALRLACESIAGAAKKLDVVLQSEDELRQEANGVIARIDSEIERLREAGELKSVNRSYQKYRLEASARGEHVLRYQEWMRRYRENLVRKLTATVRYS